MLFFIDESITRQTLSSTALDGIDNILTASARGFHATVAARSTLKHLRDLGHFGARVRGYLTGQLKNYAFLQSLLDADYARVTVKATVPGIRKISHYQWECEPSALTKVSGPTILIGENGLDADFYDWCGSYVLAQTDQNINLSCICRGGGGATTPNELSRAISAGEICLCVTDSDQSHPNSPVGVVARQSGRVVNRSGWLCAHFTIGGRSVENLFPACILERVSQSNNERNWLNLTQRLATNNITTPLLYGDLKSGTQLSRFLHLLPKHDAENLAWNPSISDMQRKGILSTSCVNNAQCANWKVHGGNAKNIKCEEKCLLSPAWGGNILSRVLKALPTEKLEIQRLNVTSIEHQLLTTVGKSVVAMCIASRTIRL